MDGRIGIFFILVLCFGWSCAARQMIDTEVSFSDIAKQMKDQEQQKETYASNKNVENERLCVLCEEFTSEALDYLAANKTQAQILETLRQGCSRMASFEKQCISLVEYYAPLFFIEVSSVQPDQFCGKINLCEKIAFISSQFHEDKCALCHRAIEEVLIKLKNPDTQLEILEALLKACNSMDNYAAKCKKLVFEYAPLILTNAEQFLETQDICFKLHVCNATVAGNGEAATVLKADI